MFLHYEDRLLRKKHYQTIYVEINLDKHDILHIEVKGPGGNVYQDLSQMAKNIWFDHTYTALYTKTLKQITNPSEIGWSAWAIKPEHAKKIIEAISKEASEDFICWLLSKNIPQETKQYLTELLQ